MVITALPPSLPGDDDLIDLYGGEQLLDRLDRPRPGGPQPLTGQTLVVVSIPLQIPRVLPVDHQVLFRDVFHSVVVLLNICRIVIHVDIHRGGVSRGGGGRYHRVLDGVLYRADRSRDHSQSTLHWELLLVRLAADRSPAINYSWVVLQYLWGRCQLVPFGSYRYLQVFGDHTERLSGFYLCHIHAVLGVFCDTIDEV